VNKQSATQSDISMLKDFSAADGRKQAAVSRGLGLRPALRLGLWTYGALDRMLIVQKPSQPVI
jgi:hypothetical protein